MCCLWLWHLIKVVGHSNCSMSLFFLHCIGQQVMIFFYYQFIWNHIFAIIYMNNLAYKMLIQCQSCFPKSILLNLPDQTQKVCQYNSIMWGSVFLFRVCKFSLFFWKTGKLKYAQKTLLSKYNAAFSVDDGNNSALRAQWHRHQRRLGPVEVSDVRWWNWGDRRLSAS